MATASSIWKYSRCLEAEHVGDDVRGEDLLAHVELHDVVVVELPGVGDLALGPGQLLLEHEEVLVGLELGVALGHGEQGLQGAGQHVVGLALVLDGLGVDGRGPGLGHALENAALVLGVALDGLDQVGNEVVAAAELDVDLGPGVVAAVPQGDQTVVHADGHEGDGHDDDEQENESTHSFLLWT